MENKVLKWVSEYQLHLFSIGAVRAALLMPDLFIIRQNVIFCTCCNKNVNFKKKRNLMVHVNGDRHRKNFLQLLIRTNYDLLNNEDEDFIAWL